MGEVTLSLDISHQVNQAVDETISVKNERRIQYTI